MRYGKKWQAIHPVSFPNPFTGEEKINVINYGPRNIKKKKKKRKKISTIFNAVFFLKQKEEK